MSISPVKRLILETMWLLDRPAKATEIAKEAGLGFPPVMMHILGLTKMGHVQMPEKGTYVITESGKRALGLPEISKEKVAEILAYQPMEKSFHFYADIGKPLNIHAASLGDFCDKILKVDLSSVEFHINRGDFEAWFAGLGDAELARKTLLVREEKMAGENLRKKLYEIVKNRRDLLARTRSASLQPEPSTSVKLT
jgi:DNA-binding PadR family transcriptional regulator